jgi:Cytochrome c
LIEENFMSAKQKTFTAFVVTFTVVVVLALGAAPTAGRKSQPSVSKLQNDLQTRRVARGQYIVNTAGCHDCHTPWKVGPKGPEPDMTLALSGHPESMKLPPPPKLGNGPWVWTASGTNTAFAGPWGVSYTANLTPDKLTGLGIWTEDIFIKTIRTGRHWGVSRPILPPMPWSVYRNLTDEDLKSVFAYLRTVKPIKNQVPEPVPPPAG